MITRYLYRNSQVVWLIVATVFVAGISSLMVMPRLEDPILGQRVGVISVKMPGANALEMEASVTKPIEEWLGQFSSIKQVRSNTRSSVTNIVIELVDSVTQSDDIWASIDRAIQSHLDDLPDGCTDPDLTVFPLKAFAAILAIVPEQPESLLTWETTLARELQSRLLALPGTETVELFGVPEFEISIQLQPQVLAANQLSTSIIARQIKNFRAKPAGNLHQNGSRMSVEIQDTDDALERLRNLMISIPGQQKLVRLGDLATVQFKPGLPQRDLAIIGGKNAVVLAVMVENQCRVDLWAEQFQATTQRFESEFAGSWSLQPLFVQSDQVRQRMANLKSNLLFSTLAVVLVVFLFMGWRCMLVLALSLPLSACLVIAGLRLLSIPIHQMSVTGLIVALGLLIDNAIVMVQEIRSRVHLGKSPIHAISESTRHLGLPLFGSTLTTVLAFLPIATMPGPSGEFVGSIAVSVILAISASFLFAITIIPALFFAPGVDASNSGMLGYGIRMHWLQSGYRKTLVTVFRRPWLGILLGMALPCVGFLLAGHLPKQFFPSTDRAQLQIELEMSAGNDIQAVRRAVKRVSSIVEQFDVVERQHWFLGRSAPTFYYNVVPRRRSTPNYAQSFVDVNPSVDMDRLVNRLQAAIDFEVFDSRVVVRKLEQGPPFDAPVEVRITGDDVRQLRQLGLQIQQMLVTTPDVIHVRSDLGDESQKLQWQTNVELANRNGLSRSDLAGFIYSHLQGADAGDLVYRGRPIPLRVRVQYEGRSIVNSLMSIRIPLPRTAVSGNGLSSRGPGSGTLPAGNLDKVHPVSIPLGSLGEFGLDADVGAIIRLDGRRTNEIKAYLRAGILPSQAVDNLKERIRQSDFKLPSGYQIELGGEAEKRDEAIGTLVANVSVVAVLMVLVLVAVLGTIRNAIIIACVAGLTLGLGPLALFCFGYPLGFMAIVGTMGLVGVAINDSIVVLAAIRENFQWRSAGHAKDPAWRADQLATIVVNSTRHILATTFTTMIGFLPLVVAGGKFWPPLAIVFSGGVAGATLLALYFTPSLFLVTRSGRPGTPTVP